MEFYRAVERFFLIKLNEGTEKKNYKSNEGTFAGSTVRNFQNLKFQNLKVSIINIQSLKIFHQ